MTKKIVLSDEAHFDLGGYVNKPTNTVRYGFIFRSIIGPFFFEYEQRVDVTVNGDRYRPMLNEFLFTKIEEEDIATFGFNRTALRGTQQKLYSMFCALLLKIALSAAELMSFGHIGTGI